MVLLKWLLIVVSLIILSILAISQPEIQYFLFELLLNFTVENSNFLSILFVLVSFIFRTGLIVSRITI